MMGTEGARATGTLARKARAVNCGN